MSSVYLGVKRFADILLSLFLLVFLLPVLLVFLVLIRLDSPGPGLYKAVRLGLEGRKFEMWKLRTMVDGADELHEIVRAENPDAINGVFFKDPGDRRMTRLGRLLRRSSLDELPQLWNVLVGDMSLVGPRPSFPSEMEPLGESALRRLSVKPGLTGLWQVSGRSSLPFEKAMELDLYYVDNASLWLDLTILARTVPAVLSRKGAF